MCSRPLRPIGLPSMSRRRPAAPLKLIRSYPRYFTLITRTARACASYPSCVAVYPCDSDRDVFCVADPLSSIHYCE
jgi:hypothetical protein